MMRIFDAQHGSGFRRAAFARRAAARFAWCFALACVALSAVAAPAAEESALPLNAALLTRDLGDPRQPGNVKLVLGLPPTLSRLTARARPEDFRVYVHPADLPPEEGVAERYRADGVYLWRHRGRIFLDARTVPTQDEEGPAAVRVIFAPGGTPLAEGVAEGSLRYTSDLVDVVLAVDVSRSMLYNDPKKRRVAAARAFIEMARQGGGIGRVGLVTFNHRATKDTPLLPLAEGETLIKALDKVGAEGLTNLDTPLDVGLAELSASRKPVVILLTDGKNEGSRYQDTHLEAARRGVRIFTVGLSEQADHDLLKKMADATDGIYFRAVKDSDLPEIYARLAAELGKRQLLRAEVLRAADGEKTWPVDATVRRLVALADGGARVGASGGEGMFSTGMSGVLMGRPEPGEWKFSWTGATPDVSALALFGDTQFFLDVFPPQLLGDKLAVGATLALGDRPLAGGSVWIEPLPGVIPSRIELFDDGMHGDGLAGDGVYAGALVVPDAPRRFDLTVRASGTAWDKGDFIRQTAGLAIKAPEPPPEATTKLSGDVDFGVLFPGETGVASVGIELDAPGPRELSLDLSWDQADRDWPDFASSLSVSPGKRAFELEITIPRTARPGSYTGRFEVGDGDEARDRSQARVTVGTVEFSAPGGVDLGTVPPGTFVSRFLAVPYRADKAAPLSFTLDGPDDLAVTPGIAKLEAGQGEIPLEIVVSAPIGQKDGEYSGVMRLAAGPGVAEIPVAWRVRQYAAAAPSLAPISGLPAAPDLPVQTRPLERTPEFSKDFWRPGQLTHAPEPVDSPWEKTEQLLRGRDGRPGDGLGSGGVSAPGLGAGTGAPGFSFPEVTQPTKSEPSFWSAWWLYILAALLLLLLLLLLLAYLLYRLGKSALARFLLVSALANIILMIIFILLLSTGMSTPAARAAPPIAVNLVEEDLPVEVRLSPAEESLLGGSSLDAADNAGSAGGGSLASEAAMAQAGSAGGGELVKEKQARLPENEAPEAELADALQPSALPLEKTEARPLRRRDRLPERNEQRTELPAPELTEMAEPPAASSQTRRDENTSSTAAPSEARLEIEADVPSDRPVWSTGEKPVRSLASDEGVLLAETAGMEKVSHDRTARRIDPRGVRRNPRELPTSYPEPRVEIDDPARDAFETSATSRNDVQGEPGVEEVRVAVRSMGPDYTGEKPGALLPPGASRLSDSEPEKMSRGVSDDSGTPELSRPVGGRRSVRGASGAESRAQPGVASAAPGSSGAGGAAGSASAAKSGTATGDAGGSRAANRGSNANAGGGDMGEKRFDDAPSTLAGGGDGVPGGTGAARTPATAAGGGGSGASPNPFASGGGGAERAPYVPAEGAGGGLAGGPQRSGATGRSDRTDPGSPQGLGAVPGTGSTSTAARDGGGGGTGTSGRGKRSGTGEGRFDDMAGMGDGVGVAGRRSGFIPGGGSSELPGTGVGDGIGVISLVGDAGDWKRIDRRQRARTVSVAASAVDMDSLLLVVGDFSRLPDSAAENLFSRLARRIGHGMTVEERRLSPNDENLSDTLLALATPEQIGDWSDADVRKVAAYLERGGHIWLDAKTRADALAAMERLARATDGDFSPLPAAHQLAETESVDALTVGGKLAAIATYRDWRKDWRFSGGGDEDTMRFLVRTVNYFLSGNADSGIVLEPGDPVGDTLVQPYREIIPDTLSSAPPAEATFVWDEFGPETSSSWRMPSWSDAGRISAISDGQGGRALKLDLGAAAKGRAAAYRTLQPTQDFSAVTAVTLDAYYDGGGEAELSMVFTVNENGAWRDYETPRVRLATGWNKLRFELDAADFRALSQGGTSDGTLPAARARTGRAGFFLYRDGQSAAIALFRDIRLVRR